MPSRRQPEILLLWMSRRRGDLAVGRLCIGAVETFYVIRIPTPGLWDIWWRKEGEHS